MACGEFERIEVCRDDLEELRDALAVVKEECPNITLRAALDRGIYLVLQEMRIYFNRGNPFPERPAKR